MTNPLFRKPQRISITMPLWIYQALEERSSREGRSISNLAACLLEIAMEERSRSAESSDDAA